MVGTQVDQFARRHRGMKQYDGSGHQTDVKHLSDDVLINIGLGKCSHFVSCFTGGIEDKLRVQFLQCFFMQKHDGKVLHLGDRATHDREGAAGIVTQSNVVDRKASKATKFDKSYLEY